MRVIRHGNVENLPHFQVFLKVDRPRFLPQSHRSYPLPDKLVMGDRHARVVVREVAAFEDGADTILPAGEVIDNEVVMTTCPRRRTVRYRLPSQLDGVADERVELRSFGIAGERRSLLAREARLSSPLPRRKSYGRWVRGALHEIDREISEAVADAGVLVSHAVGVSP